MAGTVLKLRLAGPKGNGAVLGGRVTKAGCPTPQGKGMFLSSSFSTIERCVILTLTSVGSRCSGRSGVVCRGRRCPCRGLWPRSFPRGTPGVGRGMSIFYLLSLTPFAISLTTPFRLALSSAMLFHGSGLRREAVTMRRATAGGYSWTRTVVPARIWMPRSSLLGCKFLSI